MQQPPGGNGYGYGPPPGYGPPSGYGPPPNYGYPGGYGPPPMHGVPVVYAPVAVLAPKCSRATYILLGLFLGGLGIHNFVAGRVGSGVAQLLITLLTGWLIVPIFIVGFWVLIELIAVTTDGNGVRMS